MIVTVEGHFDDIFVPVPCEPGEYSCQAQHVCNQVTGESCVSLDRRKFMRYETDQGQSYYVEVGSQVSTWELPPDGEVVAG